MNNKLLSYCIPVMNRLDDIKASLWRNLEVNRSLEDSVEFVVACFDADDECQNWVFTNFQDDLRSGYLRFVRKMPLDYWHFSWGKNAFKDLISGKIYSSLDGDNFVSLEETRKTLEVFERLSYNCIFHHFSGDWGDGTSGRVSMPVWVYKEIGYDERLLPRQYDEMDAMITAMKEYPFLVLVVLKGVDIFRMSKGLAEFRERERLINRRVEVAYPQREKPINPRGGGYVGHDPILRAFQMFNQTYSSYKNSSIPENQEHYLTELRRWKKDLLSVAEPSRLERLTLERVSDASPGESLEGIHVFSVVKNDESFLRSWYEHYKARGVAGFFLVDDFSDEPISKVFEGSDDVYVYKPRVADFRSAKTFWLQVLMTSRIRPGAWCLTVDADEFVDVEQSRFHGSFERLVSYLEERDRELCPGLLLEMLPETSVSDSDDWKSQFTAYYFDPTIEDEKYERFHSVKWAFGNFWRISRSLDFRFRVAGTIDCLRKISLFRWQPGMELNQGFHALELDGEDLFSPSAWMNQDVILPVCHYKLKKIYWPEERANKEAGKFAQYHSRTRMNLEKIFYGVRDSARHSAEQLPTRLPYRGADDFPFVKGFC